MTTLNEKPDNNQYHSTADAWKNVEWDDDDTPVDKGPGSGKKRPCLSHGAAKARSIAIARTSASGWQHRPEKWVRTWLAAINDPSARPLLQEAVDAAPANNRTTVNRVIQYLNQVATQTSWNGKDPVFALRETLVAEMGIGKSTVSRCARAAERAGLLTEGIQQWWIQVEADGEERPKRSSTVRMLVLDDAIGGARKAAAVMKKLRKQTREAREISESESEQLAARKAAVEAHKARMERLAEHAPPVGTTSGPNSTSTTAGHKLIAGIRSQLE